MVTIFLGTATVLGIFLLPWIIKEIWHPTGSFAGPINRIVAEFFAWATAIAATLETLCLGGLLSRRWVKPSLGIPAVGICATVSLIAIGCIIHLRH
ncbi:MAG: hypothetical protein AAGC93_17940 [Cyanobacteria bacterium P01_F01_bin.53]